jgi:hypothetical protein
MEIDKILDDLKESYEPYAELAVSELHHVDELRNKWQKSQDPEWLAFRDNPKTQELYKQAARTYQALYTQLANDEGTLTPVERKAMAVGKQWSLWFMRALGGDPSKVRKQVEAEIKKFAEGAGITVDNCRDL